MDLDPLNQALTVFGLKPGTVALLIIVIKYGGELFSSVRAGGGLKRIIMSFWFGEQLPKVIAEDYKKELTTPPFTPPAQ